jgi:hypothetical protein
MRNQRPGINTLTADNPVRFGENGNYMSFMPEGFDNGESAEHTWNDGYVASVRFQVLGPIDNGELQISGVPFIVDGVPCQEMTAYLNGLWIGFSRFREEATLVCPIGHNYLVPGSNRLSFVMPNAVSPHEVGVGSDMRRLAFAFRLVTLSVNR